LHIAVKGEVEGKMYWDIFLGLDKVNVGGDFSYEGRIEKGTLDEKGSQVSTFPY
jgi:hypothetical protein